MGTEWIKLWIYITRDFIRNVQCRCQEIFFFPWKLICTVKFCIKCLIYYIGLLCLHCDKVTDCVWLPSLLYEQRTCSPRSAFSSVTISILETSGKWKMVTDRPKSFFQHCVSTSMAETISMLYYDTLTCWLIVFRLCRSMKTNDLIITVVLPKLLQLSVMNFLTFEMVTLKMGTRSVTTISCHPQSVCVRFQLSRSW